MNSVAIDEIPDLPGSWRWIIDRGYYCAKLVCSDCDIAVGVEPIDGVSLVTISVVYRWLNDRPNRPTSSAPLAIVLAVARANGLASLAVAAVSVAE